LRFERELRGRLRYRAGLVLQRLIGPRRTSDRLDPREIRSVLIGRINGRLGNTLFLTPLIARLHDLLPDAQIDLALSYPHAGALLTGTPGVRQIILFPHKGANLVAGYLRALRQLRARRYDLVIDPTPFSTSGRLLLSLTHARFRLGFNMPSQWAALTHTVPLPEQAMHQGRQPAYLLRALGAPWEPQALRLRLPLQPHEVAAARAAIAKALGTVTQVGADWPIIGFFGHATGLKALPPTWWARFWQALLTAHPEIVPLEFLPAAGAAPTVRGFATLHLPAQRQLTAAIASLRLFISADAGPMHLASCTDTATIGLFQVTDPVLYGPLKSVDRSIDVAQLTPEQTAARIGAVLKE
jgi:ADP-heptose:LPS heptosyltransferase